MYFSFLLNALLALLQDGISEETTVLYMGCLPVEVDIVDEEVVSRLSFLSLLKWQKKGERAEVAMRATRRAWVGTVRSQQMGVAQASRRGKRCEGG